MARPAGVRGYRGEEAGPAGGSDVSTCGFAAACAGDPTRRIGGLGSPRVDRRMLAFYIVFHVMALGVFIVPFSRRDALIFGVSYVLRMFGVSAGYHRYFSHRSFKTSRTFQLILALLAMASWQRGVLWWAAMHRWHHRHADEAADAHSPVRHGLWRAHAGWLLDGRNAALKAELVPDLRGFPELAFLDRHYHVAALAWAAATLLVGGFSGLYWGFMVNTLLLFHVMAAGNSLAHWKGPRRYDTVDNSRNSLLYALATFGEFHNNHHHRPASANQARSRWELDAVYLALRGLQAAGVVWDLRWSGAVRSLRCANGA